MDAVTTFLDCPAGHWFNGPVAALTVHADPVPHASEVPHASVAVPVSVSPR